MSVQCHTDNLSVCSRWRLAEDNGLKHLRIFKQVSITSFLHFKRSAVLLLRQTLKNSQNPGRHIGCLPSRSFFQRMDEALSAIKVLQHGLIPPLNPKPSTLNPKLGKFQNPTLQQPPVGTAAENRS
jgi:hypothetical protein